MEKSTVEGHRKGSGIASNPAYVEWVHWGGGVQCQLAAGTSLHRTPYTNATTSGIQDYHQSLTPSYALQLCSFPRLAAILVIAIINHFNYPYFSANKSKEQGL